MIELREITKILGNHRAVDAVSLVIPDCARVAILGPSGSGKTTLLRLIAGLEKPDAGSITENGILVSSPEYCLPPSERSTGFVFQTAALWPHMTIAENILFGLEDLPENQQTDRLEDLLTRMKIRHLRERYPDEISGGEARRAALARALAPRPSILLFDEPLTNLDRELRDDLLGLITDSVASAQSTMIYVTHDEYEARVVASTIIRFRDGRIER